MGVTVGGRPRAVFDRVATRPAWVVCGGLVVLSALSALAGVSPAPALRYLPLAASVVVLGLPHGAVDYLVPARLGDRSLTESMAVVGVAYLVLGGAYAALWLVAPLPAALFFVAVTWFHWGQGDVHALVAFVDAEHLRSRPLRVATLFVRGGLPMFVPLLAFPGRYREVVGTWVELFGAEFAAAWLFAPGTRLVGGTVFLAATVATLAAGYRVAGGTRGWRVDAGETALLWVVFLTVPPLVAVGVYFCVWHSLRHVLRVASVDDGARTVAGGLRRFARDAAPLTALALGFLAVFGALVPVSSSAPDELAGLYLVFVAVLTLPHVAVVTWMDRREGVWRRPTRG
jgi:Brp/Blh family beta-carotene 15,15'-monooxygenase